VGGLLKGYQPEAVSGSGWSFVVSLNLREEPFRQTIINASGGLPELSLVKLEPDQMLKCEDMQMEASIVVDIKPDKRIGGITASERRQKIKLYMEKRRRRSFAKKVAYDCRKKVADQRIRVKGRFVTRQQALQLLDLP
jgi:hypothetical protein